MNFGEKPSLKEALKVADFYQKVYGEKKTKTFVSEVGLACVYCGTLTEDMCCGEMHHEMLYIDDDENYMLESELPDDVIIDGED